jgi:predicted nucleic-acid-binding protein
MIGLDTNVVVRLMIEDDETQARLARQLLDEASERGEPVFVSDIVLSELEWVLDSAYQVPRYRILAAVNALAGDQRFCFQDRNRVTSALGLYQQGKGDLADYLLGLRGETEGVRSTFTFDRALRGDARFTQLRS